MAVQRYLPGLALMSIVAGCGGTEPMAGSGPTAVESRAVTQVQRPMRPGMPGQPGEDVQANAQMPSWPQKWDVNNREPYGVAFGVTQPGQVTVDGIQGKRQVFYEQKVEERMEGHQGRY